jgi:signal transduction histidine kinase/DNA-binding response OmpR family regulator
LDWTALVSFVLGGALVALPFLRARARTPDPGPLQAEIERLQDRVWRLAEAEERYRAIVEAQVDAVVQRDRDGRITAADAGYVELLGLREPPLGTRIEPEVVERGPAQARRDARLSEEAIRTPAGLRWFAWIDTTISGPDGPETLRAGRDITERVVSARRLEEARARAEAATEAKSRFVATVSHECRTPLNGILGMADLLLETPLTPEQATYVRAVKSSGEALLSLIDEILDFSRIEAGRLDLASEPFDLVPLVEGVVELLAPKAQDKGIEIAAMVARDCPRRVVGDADRLRQVLFNLAGNAVKFTETGGVGVTVERIGDGLAIAVADTGPGVPPDRTATLFEEFEQGDGSLSRKHGGTGLGLAIARRIVERMGGTIGVENRPCGGAAFRVVLPLAAAAGAHEPEAGAAGLRVLVASASPFEGPFLARRLAEAGAAPVLVGSAPAALAQLAAPFDVVIADCALGEEAVRAIAPAARAAGIGRILVLLSPFDRRAFSPAAAGFDGYLVKPVRSRSLLREAAGRGRGEEPPAPSKRIPAQARARVLIAEDNDINALLATKALERLGAHADRARDGMEAVALAEASFAGTPYDLVLMDIRMPGIDGLEATRRIRRLEAALGRPPCRIVALTADAQTDAAAARAAGIDGILGKPLDYALLGRLVTEAPLAA